MKHILIIFTALLFTLSCSKSESENSIPDCLDKKISTFKDNLICDRAHGIAGLTKINGEDFSKATFVNVVWKK
ncbi:MAG: hypothetical protein IPO37_25245 [Saprospiraceae bacterium]|nr:hypothetical protein [Saprospiraceae bacterium]